MKFNLRGLLQDEEFLVAAGLLSAGSQGQSIGQAAFPSLLQAAQVKKAFGNKQRKIIKGADGYNYYADTGERVLSDVKKPEKEKNRFRILSRKEIEENPALDDNANYQLNITTGKILPIKTAIDKSTNVKVTLPSNKLEGKFSEGVGTGQATVFNEILKNADAAHNENIDLDLLVQAANQLETGVATPLITDMMKWGKRFGVNTDWLSGSGDVTGQLANAEVINVLAGNQLFGKIQQTKGSISEKEMDAFSAMTTSLSMTPKGIKNNAKIMAAINDREILKASMAEEWVSNDDGTITSLLRKKEVNGEMMTFNQMWAEYVEAKDEDGILVNPLIPEDERKEMLDLANVNLTEMESSENFIQVNGNWYYIVDEENKIYQPLKIKK